MAQLPLAPHSHSHEGVPELIHLALHRATHHLRETVVFCRDLAVAANVGEGDRVTPVVARLSTVTGDRAAGVTSVIVADADYQQTLQSLARAYPLCPLNFLLGGAGEEGDDTGFHDLLRDTIVEFSDSRSRFSTEVLACLYHAALCTGTVKLVAPVQVPNLDAISDYPDTDESRQVASSIRALCNFLVGHGAASSAWPAAFWNRGYELSGCAPY